MLFFCALKMPYRADLAAAHKEIERLRLEAENKDLTIAAREAVIDELATENSSIETAITAKDVVINELTIANSNLEAMVASLERQLEEQQSRRLSTTTTAQRAADRSSPSRSVKSPTAAFGSATPRNIGDLTKERLAASQPK